MIIISMFNSFPFLRGSINNTQPQPMLALESFDIFRVVSGDKFMKNKTIRFIKTKIFYQAKDIYLSKSTYTGKWSLKPPK